jgi:hypothetical protein
MMDAPHRPITGRFPALAAVPILAVLLLLAAGRAAGAPAVIHHDLSVTIRSADRTLAGTDILTVRPGGASRLSLLLAPGARVASVAVDGKAVPFTFSGGTLSVPLPGSGRKDAIAVTVAYEAVFDDPVPEDPVGTEDPGFGVQGTIGTRGTFLSAGARWYPDIPGSRPTFRIRIETEEGIEAVTAGERLRRESSDGSTVSEWAIGFPARGVSLSAGPYRIREGEAGDVKVYTYFYPESDPLADDYLKATIRYLDLYEELFGPYPFAKFAVVENFFPTGYGFPSYTLLGSTVIRLPFIIDTSLGHEIAHSWWGNGVYVDYGRGNWSEGLTTYVADHLYKEMASPEEGREYRLRILRDYATLVPPGKDFPLAAFTGRVDPPSRTIGYGKGAMVFHMARRLVGDEAFRGGLRAVAREKLFRTASWDDFARALGRGTTGDISAFFRQWVERPGAPTLALADVAAARGGKGWTITGRLVQERPYFTLTVPLRLETEEGSLDIVVPLKGRDARFALRTEAPPRRLVIDPDVDLFRRLDPAEIPPIVNGIKGSSSLLAVAARGLAPETLEASRTLLASLGQDKVRIVREEESAPDRLAGHDVIFLGLPDGKGFLPSLPEGLDVSRSGFVLNGTLYDRPGDALFATLPHPADRDRMSALFLPLSPAAAQEAARRVTHYGRYSYLVFRAGANRAKGTWPAADSPAVYTFRPAGGQSPRATDPAGPGSGRPR